MARISKSVDNNKSVEGEENKGAHVFKGLGGE